MNVSEKFLLKCHHYKVRWVVGGKYLQQQNHYPKYLRQRLVQGNIK